MLIFFFLHFTFDDFMSSLSKFDNDGMKSSKRHVTSVLLLIFVFMMMVLLMLLLLMMMMMIRNYWDTSSRGT